MKKKQGAIAVFIGAASFGILSTFVKLAYEKGFTLAEVTGIQAALGAFILWVLWLIVKIRKANKQALLNNTSKTPTWKVIASGSCTGLVSILYYKSVELVPASMAIVLLMQYIWIGQLLELMVFKIKPSISQIVLIICILGGTILATGLMEDPIDSFSLEGIIYGLLAATAYAIFIILSGRIGNDYPVLHKSALMITGALLLIILILQPFSLFQAETLLNIQVYGLILAVFGTVIPPLLFAYGMPKTGYSLGAVLTAVELPIAVCMSYFVLNESVSWLKWLGVLFILACIVWKNMFNKPNTLAA